MRLMFVEVDKSDSAVNWKSYVHEWIQFAFSVAKLIWRVHSKPDANAIMCDLHIWCLYWNKCRMNFHVNWSTTSDYMVEYSITNMFNPIDFLSSTTSSKRRLNFLKRFHVIFIIIKPQYPLVPFHRSMFFSFLSLSRPWVLRHAPQS